MDNARSETPSEDFCSRDVTSRKLKMFGEKAIRGDGFFRFLISVGEKLVRKLDALAFVATPLFRQCVTRPLTFVVL
jgi:hypothetical protein